MTTITTHDMSARLPHVLALLAAGEELLVTDHGQPVARMLPPEPAATPPASAADRMSRWYAWTTRNPKRTLTLDVSRESIYAGCGE